MRAIEEGDALRRTTNAPVVELALTKPWRDRPVLVRSECVALHYSHEALYS